MVIYSSVFYKWRVIYSRVVESYLLQRVVELFTAVCFVSGELFTVFCKRVVESYLLQCVL